MYGKGSQSTVGLGTESTYGTAVAATVYPPIKSESITFTRPILVSGSLTNNSTVSNIANGVVKISGGITAEIGAALDGQLTYYWNGGSPGDGYDVTNFNTENFNVTSPAGVIAAGGTLPVGVYRYKIAAVFQRATGIASDVLRYTQAVTIGSSTVTASSGNQTVNLTWVNPTAAPPGMTLVGTAIFRTVAGGASGTEKFLKYISSVTTSTSDDGSVTLGSNTASTATLYKHVFTASDNPSGGDRLKSFSAHLNKNVAEAERYAGCRMNEISFTAGGQDNIVEMSCSLMAQSVQTLANTTPVIANTAPIPGWSAAAYLDGSSTCLWMNTFNVQCTNNLTEVPGGCGSPKIRELSSGQRGVTGSFTRAFEDHTFFTKLINSQEFQIQFMLEGESVTPNGAWFDAGGGSICSPFHNMLIIDLFRCRASKAGAPISGPEQLNETVEFQAYNSPDYGTDIRITYYNSIASYV